MRKHLIIGILTALWLIPSICLGQAPKQVGEFVLGADIEDYKDRVNMKTGLQTRYQEGPMDVEILKTGGFKSGIISYGTCAFPGKILRIKLKYDNPSKAFYEKLLKRFEKKFGEPKEWRGDMFHVVEGWKWQFVDAQKNRISLILQHNLQDQNRKIGNAVKLSMTNKLAEEENSFKIKYPDFRPKAPQKKKWKKRKSSDWDLFVPK
ncbi:MAG: hypothetical protein GY859_40220 [Desulfobacterales bacterium]|nr:hypothetical protein [Desulfobacterales bacterium]